MVEMTKEKKIKKSQDLEKLLFQHAQGKLEPAQEELMNWLIQVFSGKDLTEIMKRVSYEVFKLGNVLLQANKGKSKQQKPLNLDDISFFSTEDLPDLYEFFWMRVSMNRCILKVVSETTMVSIEANGAQFEQKVFNVGAETTVNLEAIQASIEEVATKHRELVLYGKTEKQDIVSLFLRKENKKNTVVGRLRRIHVLAYNYRCSTRQK